MPAPTGGHAWGEGQYPDWYNATVAEHGFSPEQADQFFRQYVMSHPRGPDGNLIDFGPYWNRVGGMNPNPTTPGVGEMLPAGDPAPLNDDGTIINPPPGGGNPPPGNDVADPNFRGRLPGQSNQAPPPRPEAPPPGAPPGNWLLRGNRNVGYRWVWLQNGGGIYNAPAVTPPHDTTRIVDDGSSDTPPAPPAPPAPPPPVDPYHYNSAAAGAQASARAGRQRASAAPAPAARVARGAPGRPRPSQVDEPPATNTTTPPKRRSNNGLGDAYL
jgi:hypothetical protein